MYLILPPPHFSLCPMQTLAGFPEQALLQEEQGRSSLGG